MNNHQSNHSVVHSEMRISPLLDAALCGLSAVWTPLYRSSALTRPGPRVYLEPTDILQIALIFRLECSRMRCGRPIDWSPSWLNFSPKTSFQLQSHKPQLKTRNNPQEHAGKTKGTWIWHFWLAADQSCTLEDVQSRMWSFEQGRCPTCGLIMVGV